MLKAVSAEKLEESIAKFEKLLEAESEIPELLSNLNQRELSISEAAYRLGFDKGVHRGIYETLKSFRTDLKRLEDAPNQDPV